MSVISTHEESGGFVTIIKGLSLVVAEVDREDVETADEAGTDNIVVCVDVIVSSEVALLWLLAIDDTSEVVACMILVVAKLDEDDAIYVVIEYVVVTTVEVAGTKMKRNKNNKNIFKKMKECVGISKPKKHTNKSRMVSYQQN